MNTAIIEFDALSDSIRAAAQDHDLGFVGWLRFAFVFVGRIEIRCTGSELCSAGINTLVHRVDAQFQSTFSDSRFFHAENRRHSGV